MGYKPKELKLKVHGYYDLAQAVIQQWNVDGRPRGDTKGIEMWAELIQSHEQLMHRGFGVKQGSLRGVKRRK